MSLQKLTAQFGFNVDAKSVDAAINSVNSIDKEIGRVSRGVEKFMGLLGAGGIGAGIFAFAKSAVEDFAKEEQSINQLQNALANIGITDRSVTEDLMEFVKAMAKVSMATDEEIVDAERSLIQRGLWGDALKRAVKDSLDLATKTGSLADAANIVGKSFQGVTKGLNALGIEIDSGIPKAKVFEEVHRQIAEHFSGAASAQMEGYTGRIHILSVEMDDLKKAIGERVLPVLQFWVEYLNEILDKTDKIAVGGNKTTAGSSNYISALPALLAKQKELEMSAASQLQFGGKITKELQAQLDLYAKIIAQTKSFEAVHSSSAKPGSLIPTKNAGSDLIAIKIPGSATTEIDSATVAWVRSNQAMEAYFTGWAGHQVQFIAAIRPTEELRATVNAETWEKIESDWKAAEQKNKATVEAVKDAWEKGSHTISGGFAEAMQQMKQKGENWRDSWIQVMNASTSAAASAMHEFVHSSGNEFTKLGKLAEGMFKGILNAFESMIEQMIARKAIMALFSGGAGALPGIGNFFGFADGGYTGDGNPSDVAGIVHKGEFVLDANVTRAIRAGAPQSGVSSLTGAGGNAVTITQNITLQGGGTQDIGELCRAIGDATRNGLRQAGEMANVITKVGTKKAGVTAL